MGKVRLEQTAAKLESSNDNQLTSDVASFVSSLGLSGAVNPIGFEDRDFRPAASKKKLSEKPGKTQYSPLGEKQRGDTRRHSNGAGATADRHAHKKKPMKTARDWKESAGPRPGESKGLTSLLGRNEPAVWYIAAERLEQLSASPQDSGIADPEAAEELRQRAEQLLAREADAFEQEMGVRNASDLRWLQTVRKSGTTADKIAAMTLLLRESAVANMKSLDSLLHMAGKRVGGKGVVSQAMDALRDLFLAVLLPSRKLKYFEQQPLKAIPKGKAGDRYLLYWYTEDCVKRRYSVYIGALEEASRGMLPFLKDRSLSTMCTLLREKAEGEHKLLTAIVNKLGDPDRKIASKACHLLSVLLQSHPVMKPVVVREVELLIMRPGQTERGRYCCLLVLNQMVLSHRKEEGGGNLAKKLIGIYFTVFRCIMSGKMGFAAAQATAAANSNAEKSKSQGKHGKADGKVNGKGNGVKAGSSVGAKAGGTSEDDGGKQQEQKSSSMDSGLLTALLTGVRRAFPYVEQGDVESVIDQHSPLLFRIIHTTTFNTALQALLLMHQLMTARSTASDRMYRAMYAVLLDHQVTRSPKAAMFLGLLYKALKDDVSVKRVAAFVKRLLQVAVEAPPHFAAGALLVSSQLAQDHPGLWQNIVQGEEGVEEEEKFQDIEDEDDQQERQQDDAQGDDDVAVRAVSGAAASPSKAADAHGYVITSSGYDMKKRDPLYCKAERSCLWELCVLASHAHPSVAAFARTLLAATPIVYDGDPLKDFTLTAFLDKFLEKKPKSAPKGSSLMQPISHKPAASNQLPGTAAFAALAEADVAPDNLFFHKYYSLSSVKSKREANRKKRQEKAGDEAEGDVDSDEDDVIDAFLAGEEDHGEEGIGADPNSQYDYSMLADAMKGGRKEAGKDGTAEEGNEDDDDGDGDVIEEHSEGEEDMEGLAMSDDDFGSMDDDDDVVDVAVDDDDDDEGSDDADDDDDDVGLDDINPLDVPSASGSDVASSGESGSGEDDDDDGDDDDDWEMADPSRIVRPKGSSTGVDHHGTGKEKSSGCKPKAGQKRSRGKKQSKGDDSVFAAAEDYQHLIDNDTGEGMVASKEDGRKKHKPRKHIVSVAKRKNANRNKKMRGD